MNTWIMPIFGKKKLQLRPTNDQMEVFYILGIFDYISGENERWELDVFVLGVPGILKKMVNYGSRKNDNLRAPKGQ